MLNRNLLEICITPFSLSLMVEQHSSKVLILVRIQKRMSLDLLNKLFCVTTPVSVGKIRLSKIITFLAAPCGPLRTGYITKYLVSREESI